MSGKKTHWLDEQYPDMEPEKKLAFRFGIRALWAFVGCMVIFASCSMVTCTAG